MNAPRPVSRSFWETTFFAVPWPEHDERKGEIVDYIYASRDKQTANVASGVAAGAKPAQGVYESSFDLLDHDHHGLRALREFIESSVAEAVVQINGNQVRVADLEVDIRESWFHVTHSGGFHDSHYHGNCSWCGIYYLQIGDSGPAGQAAPNGGSRFYSPLWKGGHFGDYGNRYLDNTSVDPPIRDGLLLLFPSYLLHSGLPYFGEQDRIVIAFNTSTERRQDVGHAG